MGKPKSRIKRFVVKDPVYGRSLHVFLNCPEDIFLKVVAKEGYTVDFKKDFDPSDAAAYFTFDTEGGATRSFLWAESFDKGLDDVGIIIHEVYHHVAFAMKHAGVGGEEAWAYYLQFMVRGVLEGSL